MSNKITLLLDTNILLDIALQRVGYESSADIFRWISQWKYVAFVAAHSLPTVFYYTSKSANAAKAKEYIRSLLLLIEVLPLDHSSTCIALESEMDDFEDALVDICAVWAWVDAIVTGNIADFISAQTPVYTANDFLKKFG